MAYYLFYNVYIKKDVAIKLRLMKSVLCFIYLLKKSNTIF